MINDYDISYPNLTLQKKVGTYIFTLFSSEKSLKTHRKKPSAVNKTKKEVSNEIVWKQAKNKVSEEQEEKNKVAIFARYLWH